MFLWDSLSETKKIIPTNKKIINFYLCGPTVYNYIHIGNARPLINFDVLNRLMKLRGYQVNYVHNFTDIDDKIIEQANHNKSSEIEITTFYIQAYNQDLSRLKILKPNQQPKVTDYIGDIINFIAKLVKSKNAYVKNGSVYFNVAKNLDEYGKIINLNKGKSDKNAYVIDEGSLKKLKNLEKNHHRDFALWKNTDIGVTWASPWGRGRPGWHTECVLFNQKLFNKETIDIHAGGIDLKFPHHENERIQWIALNKKPLSNLWIHNGQLNINDVKMSKSLKNTILLKDFLEEYHPDVLKFVILNNHYRSPININDDTFIKAQKTVVKWKNQLQKKSNELQLSDLNFETISDYANLSESNWKEFITFLESDLNTANAISVIENSIKKLNQIKDLYEANKLWQIIKKMTEILGFHLDLQTLTDEDLVLLQDWNRHKENQDYDKADLIRTVLSGKGII